jgi:acyl-ACP thioesterase
VNNARYVEWIFDYLWPDIPGNGMPRSFEIEYKQEVKPGDIVGVREKSKSLEVIHNSLGSRRINVSWLEWDSASLAGKLINRPERDQIPETIKEQLIVELYSK